MSSSTTPADRCAAPSGLEAPSGVEAPSEVEAPAPFAASGGLQVAPAPVEDPFSALDALMSVIEALCPIWPERDLFRATGEMLL